MYELAKEKVTDPVTKQNLSITKKVAMSTSTNNCVASPIFYPQETAIWLQQ